MKITGIDYERLFPLGQYENERITLHADVDVTENPFDVFKDLKATVFQLHGEGKLLEESKKVVESDKRLEHVKKAFPDDLRNLLIFEEQENMVIIKPKEFLGSANFAKIGAVVRELKGEYVSAGRESHFKIKR